MFNKFPLPASLAALALMLLAPPLMAATDSASTAEQLSKIENDTLLLKAQERQLAVRLTIAGQQGDLAGKHAETNRLTQPAKAGDPTVLAIEGIGRATYATLLMDNGATLDVTGGDTLPNGMSVLSIRANEVVLQNGKKGRIRLAGAAPATPAGAGAGASAAAGFSAPSRVQFVLPPMSPSSLSAARGTTP